MKISDLRFFSGGHFHCFLPKRFLKILEDDIHTVFLKNSSGLKSLDYTKKKYINNISYENEISKDFELLLKITEYIENEIKTLDTDLRSINFIEESVRSVAVDTTLTRLSESYESVIFLINNIFYFESFAIIRLIFEQLVYCINICDISDEEYDSLSKNRLKNELSSTNINKIKKLFPNLNLGTFYKYLSSATHVGIREAGKFIEYNQEIERVVIVSRTVRMALDASFHLLRVLDIHQIVFEYSLKEHLPTNLKNRSINSENFKIIENRKTRSQALKFNEEFKSLKTKHNNG